MACGGSTLKGLSDISKSNTCTLINSQYLQLNSVSLINV